MHLKLAFRAQKDITPQTLIATLPVNALGITDFESLRINSEATYNAYRMIFASNKISGFSRTIPSGALIEADIIAFIS